jgi:hypothetical protein
VQCQAELAPEALDAAVETQTWQPWSDQRSRQWAIGTDRGEQGGMQPGGVSGWRPELQQTEGGRRAAYGAAAAATQRQPGG